MAVDISQGSLNFGSSLDPTGFLSGAKIIEQSNTRLIEALAATAKKSNAVNSQMARSAKEAANNYSDLEKKILATFTVASIGSFISKLVSVRGEFQKINSSFVTMLGSKEKADKLMAEATKLAATTPFSLTDVATGAKQLLAYGFSADTITKNLTSLGNIAAGIKAPLGDIVYLYGTLKASGRVTQLDINQFAGRGIPIYEELAKVMGVTTDKVRGLVSTGKIGFPEIEKAFNNMTGAGGKFFNLMEEQSKSLSGQVSNLGDAFDTMLNKIGKSSEGFLSSGIQGAITLVQNYDKVLEALGVLVATYGAYKAAVIVATVAQTAQATGYTVLEVAEYRLLLAQEALNASMLANPYILVATSLAALISAMVLFSDNTTYAEKNQKRLNEETQNFVKLQDERKQKYEQLSTALRDVNTTEFEGNRLYKELQSLYPELFKNLSKEEFLKKSVAEAQKEINKANDQSKVDLVGKQAQEAQAQVERLIQSLNNYDKTRAAYGSQTGGLISKSDLKDNLEAARQEAQRLTEEYQKQKQELYFSNLSDDKKLDYLKNQKSELEKQKKQLEDLNKLSGDFNNYLNKLSIAGLNKQLDDTQSKINSLINKDTGKTTVRTIGVIDEDIKKLKDTESSISDRAGHIAYEKQLSNLLKERSKITGELTKTAKTELNFAEKRLELIGKIDDAEKIASAAYLGRNEKEIAENKAKYQAMLDDIEKFNKNAPKDKKIGQDVIVRVTNLSNTEEAAIKYKQETAQQEIEFEKQKKLFQDFEQYKTTFGEKAAKERFGNEMRSESELLNQLKAKAKELEDKVTKGTLNQNEKDRLDQYKKQIDGLEELDQKRYAAAFQAAKTHTQKLLEIDEDYNSKVKALGANATVEQLAELQRQRTEKRQAENASNLDTERAYADLFASFETSTKKRIRIAIEAEKQILKAKLASGEISQQDYNSRLNALNNANAKFVTSTDGAFKKVADAFKKYKEAKEGIEKGDAFKNLASEASNAAFLIQGVFSGITDGLASLGVGTDKYTQQTFKNIEGLLGGIGDLGKGLASGNPIDVVKGSIEILSNAIQLFNTKDKKLEKKIEGYKAQLKSLQAAYKALDQQVKYAVGEDVYRDQAAQIRNLQQQQQALINARNAESQKKKSDAGKIADYNSQIQDIKYQIQDLQKSIQDTLLQTNFKDFSNQLADALSSAFAAGEDGTKALDQSFDQMIQNMIKNALKLKLLEGPVNDVLNQLADYMKTHNNDATGFDFDAAKKKLEAAGKQFNDALAGFGDLFKNTVDPTANNNTLSGAIKGITADQADILAGQFGGLRLAQLENNSILRTNHAQLMAMNTQKLNNLIQIEINTRGTKENTDRLYYIQNSLESLDKKISSDALLRGAGLKGP